MRSTPRVASTIDASQSAAKQIANNATTALAKPVQITREQVSDASELTRQLQAMNQVISSVTLAQRSHPEQAPITFKNVACGSGGAKVTLRHNFGSFAEYIVTKWTGAATVSGPSLVGDESDSSNVLTDNNSLVLRSYVVGTANIRVYPGA